MEISMKYVAMQYLETLTKSITETIDFLILTLEYTKRFPEKYVLFLNLKFYHSKKNSIYKYFSTKTFLLFNSYLLSFSSDYRNHSQSN